jgi:hypothetical protein
VGSERRVGGIPLREIRGMGILAHVVFVTGLPTSSLSPRTTSGSPNFAPDSLASLGKQWRHLVRRSKGNRDEVGSSAVRSDGGLARVHGPGGPCHDPGAAGRHQFSVATG